MKACFNTITAGCQKPLEEIIDACGAARFSGIEIDLHHLDAATQRISFQKIRDRLANVNSEPTSVMAFDLAPLAEDLAAIDRFKRGVEAAHGLGSPLLLVYGATNISLPFCRLVELVVFCRIRILATSDRLAFGVMEVARRY
jgi:2-keto-myo-inositol isomerase